MLQQHFETKYADIFKIQSMTITLSHDSILQWSFKVAGRMLFNDLVINEIDLLGMKDESFSIKCYGFYSYYDD